MAALLGQLISEFESLWPLTGAEAWDAPGLVTGSSQDRISRVLLTVDVTSEVIEEAIDGGFDLVLAHHPFIMRGVSSVSADNAKGSTLTRSIRSNVAIYAAHTNADIVENGVSDTLAKAIGLSNIEPLISDGSMVGHGRIGVLPEAISLGNFARFVAGVLPSTASGVRVAGDYEQHVRKVALCAGAGDSFIERAIEASADVYLTSDLRHHVVQDVRESAIVGGGGPAIIDVSHWAAEWLWLEVAAGQLASKFSEIQFVVSHIRTDPWDFVVTQ